MGIKVNQNLQKRKTRKQMYSHFYLYTGYHKDLINFILHCHTLILEAEKWSLKGVKLKIYKTCLWAGSYLSKFSLLGSNASSLD